MLWYKHRIGGECCQVNGGWYIGNSDPPASVIRRLHRELGGRAEVLALVPPRHAHAADAAHYSSERQLMVWNAPERGPADRLSLGSAVRAPVPCAST
jgi:hypothetical protein